MSKPMMDDDMMEDEQPQAAPPATEESLLSTLVRKARKLLGLDDLAPDSTAGQAAQGAAAVADLVRASRGPARDKDGLLVGSSRGVIHENVKTLRNKGMSEAEAIKLAQAAADRSLAAEKKGRK